MATTKKTTKKKTRKRTKKPATKAQAAAQSNVVELDSKRKPSSKARSQTYVPGTEPERDPKITALANDLYDARAERMRLTEEETEAADALIAAMQAKGLHFYQDEELGMKVELSSGKTKVKVKRLTND